MGSLEQKLKEAISSTVKITSQQDQSEQEPENETEEEAARRLPKQKKEVVDKQVSHVLSKLNYYKTMNPYAPDFLGDRLTYPKKRRWLVRLRRLPDLVELREEVNKFSESRKITNPRKKINQYIKYHPFHPELRALKGIQIFNDTAQSGLDKSKLDVLRQSVKETGGALYNGGISIFNTTWFIKIYLKFLETLQTRISNEYNNLNTNFHWQIRQASDELHRMLLQVTSMLSVKSHLNGLTMLNAKMKGSAYTYESISHEELMEASLAMVKGVSKSFGSGKTSNYVIWVIISLSSLYARIPMLKKLVQNTMAAIPDVSRELTLQKIMVGMVARVTEYQLALAEGDLDRIRNLASSLYQRCQDTISEHLSNVAFLSKSYEVDPFLKAAWIVKESEGLFEKAQYLQMLHEAQKMLRIVISNSGQVRGSYEFARQLQQDIDLTMARYDMSQYDTEVEE